MPTDYLGDGVYVRFDGAGFVLMANSHIDPTDTVYLEWSVVDALQRYIDKVRKG